MVADADAREGNGKQVPARPHPTFGGKQRIYIYDPKRDINTVELSDVFELALCGISVGLRMIPPEMLDAVYDSMSDGVKRHFKIQERSPIVVAKG